MSKVQVKELNNYIEAFNDKNINIIVSGSFNQKSKLELAKCTYNTRDGKLRIKNNNSYFEIDISFVYFIKINNELNKIYFYLDNEDRITIAK